MNRHEVFRMAALSVPVLLILSSGCKPKSEVAPPPATVEFATVEQKDVPIYGEWVGTLEGNVNATISAQVSGYLVTRNYLEGSVVTNAQVLFQIEPAPFQATLARAKAQLDEAQARKGKTAMDVKRYTPLAATQAISQQELDDAVQADLAAAAEVANAQAAIQQAQLNLNFTTIMSPVDGIAGLAQAQVGDLVGPGSGPLTTVAQLDPIRVYFSVSQELMTQIQERMLAEGKLLRQDKDYQGPVLQLTLISGSVYPQQGRVRFANNQVDVRTGTVRVVGEFPNPNHLLVPGMFTRVRGLLGTETNALLVPQRSVSETQGRYLIAVVDSENKISIRSVTAGEKVGELWVIKGNVRAGERVVAEGIQKVRDGAVVNPVPLGEHAQTASEPKPAETRE